MAPQATRRLSAIAFADMVGYSSLSQHDEPLALEYARELHARLRAQVARHRGRIVKTLGDGVLAEFESALEATECAVELQRELHESNAGRRGPKLEARVGIHVGDVVHEEDDVAGDTVNIAARIEPLAEPAGVALSGVVFEQVGNKIPYPATRLEHAFLKNIDTPIAVYSLDLPWHSAPAARVTPFTDRTTELGRLRQAVAQATQKQGAIVAIMGESGVGKTRLSEEALRLAARRGFRVARARAFENVQTGPYALWAEVARELLRDAPSPLLYKAADGCARELSGLLPEIAERLGPGPPVPELPPDRARLQFFAGLSRFLENLSREAPLALLLDDLQWTDVETLSFLQYFSDRVAELPIVVALTYRDLELDADHPLRRALLDLRVKRRLNEVALPRLGADDTHTLVEAVLGGASVSEELSPEIAEKTGGNPLFVEEVLRSLSEEGALVRTASGWAVQPGSSVSIPPTVQETVLRRVRRLGPELQEVLETASILGNEFELDDLRQLCGTDEGRLLALTEAALRARLLVERELAPGRPVYRLADEHLQGVLYSAVSLGRRQRLHRRAGEVLEARLGARAEARAAELAQHYLLGAQPAKSFEWSCRAGARAREVFAHEQAIDAYQRAASLVETAVAEASERAEWETRGASVYEQLGNEQYSLAQYDSSHASHLRGSTLARSRDPTNAARLLTYAAEARQRTNDYKGAQEEAEQAGALLERLASAERGAAWWSAWKEVQHVLFSATYWLNDTDGRARILERVRPVLEASESDGDQAQLFSMLALHGWRRDRTVTDESLGFYRRSLEHSARERASKGQTEMPLAELLTFGFMLYWHGDFEAGRVQLTASLELAEKTRQFTTIARANNYLLAVARRTGDVEEARRLVASTRSAAVQAELPEYEAFASANEAWLLWRAGEVDRVDALGQDALDTWARLPERYPVDWMALWPMIALALARANLPRAIDLARGLLAPTQEPLPPPLHDLVRTATQTASQGNVTEAAEVLGRAVELARQTGFL